MWYHIPHSPACSAPHSSPKWGCQRLGQAAAGASGAARKYWTSAGMEKAPCMGQGAAAGCGQGLGMPPRTGQSHGKSGRAWTGALGGDFYKQRVFPGVPNHLTLAADRGRTIAPPKR